MSNRRRREVSLHVKSFGGSGSGSGSTRSDSSVSSSSFRRFQSPYRSLTNQNTNNNNNKENAARSSSTTTLMMMMQSNGTSVAALPLFLQQPQQQIQTSLATTTTTTSSIIDPLVQQQQTITWSNPGATTTTTTTTTTMVSTEQQQQQSTASSSTATTTTTTKLLSKNAARLLSLGAAALYGTNFALVKWMGETTDLPAGLSTTLRFGMAALATSPWLLSATTRKDTTTASTTTTSTTTTTASTATRPSSALWAGLEVGLWNAVGYVAQAVGLTTTPASQSAFLCSLAVLVVPLLDLFFADNNNNNNEHRQQQWTGALLALAGVAVLELQPQQQADLATAAASSSWAWTDVASYVQPIAFGVGFWKMERAMQQFPSQADSTTAAQLLAVFAGAALYCLVMESHLFSFFAATDTATSTTTASLFHYLNDPIIWMGLLWTGVIATALTIYMETLALQTLTAAESTLLFSTEPVWGSAFATVLLGERFGWQGWIGGSLVLAGCLFANVNNNNNNETNTAHDTVS